MYLEVYPDVVLAINFFIDLILVFLVMKVNKKSSSKLRIVLAAATGGICAAIASVFPWMNSIIKILLIYIAASLLMIIIAFGRLKLLDLLKQWIVLNLITYFVGGFMNSIYYHSNLRVLLINIGKANVFSNLSALHIIVAGCLVTIIALFVLWLLRLYHVHRPLVYDVELVLEDRHVQTRGLMDTGNCLYDPILRKPVMVMESSLVDELLTPNIRHDMEIAMKYLKGETEEMPWQQSQDRLLRFSFIPYRSIEKCGMLLGIRIDKLVIHTGNESICNEKVIAAICDNRLTDCSENYRVVLHKELL